MDNHIQDYNLDFTDDVGSPFSDNQTRQRLKSWLIDQLDRKTCPGCDWIDKKGGLFKLVWKHYGRPGFDEDKDAKIFREWAIHTRRHNPGDPSEVSIWKTRFRNALHKMKKDLEEVNSMHQLEGNEPFRVYRLRSPDEDVTVKIENVHSFHTKEFSNYKDSSKISRNEVYVLDNLKVYQTKKPANHNESSQHSSPRDEVHVQESTKSYHTKEFEKYKESSQHISQRESAFVPESPRPYQAKKFAKYNASSASTPQRDVIFVPRTKEFLKYKEPNEMNPQPDEVSVPKWHHYNYSHHSSTDKTKPERRASSSLSSHGMDSESSEKHFEYREDRDSRSEYQRDDRRYSVNVDVEQFRDTENNFRPSTKKHFQGKRNHERMHKDYYMEKTMRVTESASNNIYEREMDEDEAFGRHVTSSFRNIYDTRSKEYAKVKIQEVLYKAKFGFLTQAANCQTGVRETIGHPMAMPRLNYNNQSVTETLQQSQNVPRLVRPLSREQLKSPQLSYNQAELETMHQQQNVPRLVRPLSRDHLKSPRLSYNNQADTTEIIQQSQDVPPLSQPLSREQLKTPKVEDSPVYNSYN